MVKATWLITGASSGLGFALAEHVLARGDAVTLAARSTGAMSVLAGSYPDTAHVVTLDVTDAGQRERAINETERRFGAIDILVNNAGIDFLGAIEEQREQDYRQTFKVNFFAAIALLRAVLPRMRRRGSGMIANMSSMDGVTSLAANGFYSSSKFALEGATEALWQEIEPFGLHAMLIEPGSFRTGIETRPHFSGDTIEAYVATSGAFRLAMETNSDAMFPGDPALAAAAIYTALKSDSPPHRLILGSDAHQRIGVKLHSLQIEFEAGRDVAYSTDIAGHVSAAS